MKILIGCEESQTICKEFRNLSIECFSCDLLPCSGGYSEWHIQGDVEDKALPASERRAHPRYPNRAQDREAAVEFFMKLANAPIPHIAIENPIGIMSSRWRKPDCIVNPWQFGDEAQKSTCLWLKNLPKLVPTNIVGKGEFVEFSSGKKQPKYADAISKAKTPEERRTLRSKTFIGIARAMAEQWGKYISTTE